MIQKITLEEAKEIIHTCFSNTTSESCQGCKYWHQHYEESMSPCLYQRTRGEIPKEIYRQAPHYYGIENAEQYMKDMNVVRLYFKLKKI